MKIKSFVSSNTKKEKCITGLLVLSAICVSVENYWQTRKSDLENRLIYQLTQVTASNSALAANTSEIMLERSLLEVCKSKNLNLCGSSEFILRGDVLLRDGLRSSAANNIDTLNTLLLKTQEETKKNVVIINVINIINYVLLIVAIILVLFKASWY